MYRYGLNSLPLKKFIHVVLCCFLLAVGVVPRLEAADSADSATSKIRQKSAAFPWGVQGPRKMPLTICTIKDDSRGRFSNAVYTSWRRWIFSALTSTWGRVPGVEIQDKGNCSDKISTVMEITIVRDGAWGNCGQNCIVSGIANSANTDGATSRQAELSLKSVVVHEVGHGLGLMHEHQIPNRPHLCPREQNILDGCRRCIKAKIICAAKDYAACLPGKLAVDVKLTKTQRDDVQARINDRIKFSDAQILTTYDPLSIMNYCSVDNGRDSKDFYPTSRDLLGMEMLYSKDRNHPIGCDTGCFYSHDGVIVRSNGAITSDWTARGAVNIKMWWGSYSGRSIPANVLANGTSRVSYRFTNPRGTLLQGGGIVNKSNAMHSAIISTIND